MAAAFYALGSLLIACGGIWFLYGLISVVPSGRFLALVPIGVAAAYVVLAGALFVAVGAIIRRLDWLVEGRAMRSPDRDRYREQDEAAPSGRRDPASRPSKIDRYFR
jgi:hypothetical protein